MKRINKILLTKSSKAFVVFIILLILFLTSGKELFHNHPNNLFEHNDCPVLIISQVLSSGIIFYFEFPSERLVEFFIEKPQNPFFVNPHLLSLRLRSPPIVWQLPGPIKVLSIFKMEIIMYAIQRYSLFTAVLFIFLFAISNLNAEIINGTIKGKVYSAEGV